MPSKEQAPASNKTAGQTSTAVSSVRQTPEAREQRAQSAHPAAILNQFNLGQHRLTAPDVMQMQQTIGNRAVGRMLAGETQNSLARARENRTGLPDNLKAGIENLSGLSLDDVRVHYNSSEPARLHSLAYTQGTHIHVAPGEEEHLAHEAWHAVQQKQGRVKATTQMKGAAVNDSPALEAEADRFGQLAARSATAPRAQMSAHEGVENNQTLASSASRDTTRQSVDGSVYQLRVDPVVDPDVEDAVKPTFQSVLKMGPFDRFAGMSLDELNWVTFANNIYDIIENARANADDDEQIADLARLEKTADSYVIEGNELVEEFDAAEEATGRPVRRGRRRDRDDDRRGRGASPPRKSRKRDSSRSRDYDSDEESEEEEKARTKEAIAEDFKDLRRSLMLLQAQLQKVYSLSEGGFSAKGRATEIENVKKTTASKPHDNTYFSGISLDGKALNINVNKPAGGGDAGTLYLRVSGQVVGNQSAVKTSEKKKALDELEEDLDEPDTAQTATYKGAIAAKDRGKGQETNMGQTNARGYAWLTNTPGWNTTRWEWLHIRAASLGGATDATNLVLGTRDSNTHMMPFESNIKSLSKIANENPNYDNVKVDFTAENKVGGVPHKYQNIKISWKLKKSSTAPAKTKEPRGVATFTPLKTDSVLSKTEVGWLEDALRAVKEGL